MKAIPKKNLAKVSNLVRNAEVAERKKNMALSALTRAAMVGFLVWSGSAVPQATAGDAAPPFARMPPVTSLPAIATPVKKGEFALYPSRLVKGPDEQWESYLGGPIVRNVINPTLTVMIPQLGKANGTAVIYAPGGGFLYLGMNDREPQQLVDAGVTVFILKYRTNPTDRDSRAFLTNMYKWLAELVASERRPEAANEPRLHAPAQVLEDGLAAVRLVRSRAKEWGIDPKRVGFMGGSAGGITALDLAFTPDDAARPDFIVTMIASKKLEPVPASAPPLFAASSNDDPLAPGTTENLVAAWSKAGRPVEAHFYERGGHGLPQGTSGERWFDALLSWMAMHGWISPSK
jgi:acetyl esterase/lipase